MIFAPATAALRAQAFAPVTPAPTLRAWALSCTSRPALSVNGAHPAVYAARLDVDVRRAATGACIRRATRQRVAEWERTVQASVRGGLPPTVSLDAERQRSAATSITASAH